jgi:hypothetical protein
MFSVELCDCPKTFLLHGFELVAWISFSFWTWNVHEHSCSFLNNVPLLFEQSFAWSLRRFNLFDYWLHGPTLIHIFSRINSLLCGVSSRACYFSLLDVSKRHEKKVVCFGVWWGGGKIERRKRGRVQALWASERTRRVEYDLARIDSSWRRSKMHRPGRGKASVEGEPALFASLLFFIARLLQQRCKITTGSMKSKGKLGASFFFLPFFLIRFIYSIFLSPRNPIRHEWRS